MKLLEKHTFEGDKVQIHEVVNFGKIFNSEITGMKLSSDKNFIFCSSKYDNCVKLFSISEKKIIKEFVLDKNVEELDC